MNIPSSLRPYRSRAIGSSNAVGHHAWDIGNGRWDAEDDAIAYCLDAVRSIPAGSCRGSINGRPVLTWVVRQDA